MADETSDNLLALFDTAPLNRRYWVSFALLSALFVLEFFDFLVVGYLLAVLGPQWHLTYGQSALILYSGGVGSILGALVFGGFADLWGRKAQMIIGTFICAVSAGLIGLVPSGSWQIFAVLRFFVGVGLTAGVVPSLTILVELTPTRHRTLLTSFYIVFASAGGLLASTTSAALLAALGWRGVAMLGVAPAFVGILIWIFVPKSVRWLAAKGRFAEARAKVAQASRPAAPVGAATDRTRPTTQPRGKLSELYHHPRMFWETVLIWGGSSTAGLRRLSVGSDDCRHGAQRSGAEGRRLFCVRRSGWRRRQDHRDVPGAAARPAPARSDLGIGRRHRARGGGLLPRCRSSAARP